MDFSSKVFLLGAFVCLIGSSLAYYPDLKDHYLSDVLLRELVDVVGKDFVDESDDYLEPLPMNNNARLALMARASKDMGEDYDGLYLEGNPNPSLREQEFMQHSSLWGHHYVSGGAGEGPHQPKPQVKSDSTLPAYCNPPNPCPVGFTEDQGCTQDFENTAAFSREYQNSQECMCDSEHNFDCSAAEQQEPNGQNNFESFLAQQFNGQDHKNMVSKKFQVKKSVNPFLQGEKLPIAAKKGIHVN